MPAEPAPARSRAGVCRVVSGTRELERHFAIRHAVFVAEQGVFAPSDRDQRDQDPATLHVLGRWDGEPAGAVRLYRLPEPGLWKGDRLAVLPRYRQHRLGELLVRFAVRTAAERGGERMVAQIQLPNVHLFEGLGWRRQGPPADYAGRPHQPMEIGLR